MKALHAAGSRVQTPASGPTGIQTGPVPQTGSQTRPVPKLDLQKLRATFRRMIQNRN